MDLACGTGIAARLAARQVDGNGKIVGLDINPAMLAMARLASRGLTPPIDWQEGSATDIPLPDASFDVVLCAASLMYFANQQGTQEMYRVLAPGGRLALTVWRPIQYSPGYRALAEALGRHVSDEAEGMMRSPFSLGDAEKIRALIVDGGFSKVRIRLETDMARYASAEEILQIQATSTPIGAHIARVDDAARAALVDDLRLATRSYQDDDGLALPVEAYLVIAHK